MAKTRIGHALLLVSLAAVGCGREKRTALDLVVHPNGAIYQVSITHVLVSGVDGGSPRDLVEQGSAPVFPASPRRLVNSDVLTLWFADEDAGATVTVTAVGLDECGNAVTVPTTAASQGPLAKDATVTADLTLEATIQTSCQGGAGGKGGGAGTGGAGTAGGGTGGTTAAAGSGGLAGAAGNGAAGLGGAGPAGAGGRGGGTAGVGPAGAGGRGGSAGTGFAGSGGRGGGTAVGVAGTGGRAGAGGAGAGGAGGGVRHCPMHPAAVPTTARMYQPTNITTACGYAIPVTGDGTVDHVRTSTVPNTSNWALWDQNHFLAASAAACGRCVQVNNGVFNKSTVVTIVGVCPGGACGNPASEFALSRSAFSELGGDISTGLLPPGITPTWQYVECPYPDAAPAPIYAETSIQNGARNGVRFIDIRDGITAVELIPSSAGALGGLLTRNPDNFWRLPNSPPFDSQGFTVRLTNINGQTVLSSKLGAGTQQLESAGVQFPSCIAP